MESNFIGILGGHQKGPRIFLILVQKDLQQKVTQHQGSIRVLNLGFGFKTKPSPFPPSLPPFPTTTSNVITTGASLRKVVKKIETQSRNCTDPLLV